MPNYLSFKHSEAKNRWGHGPNWNNESVFGPSKPIPARYNGGQCSACKSRHIKIGNLIKRYDGGWAVIGCIARKKQSPARDTATTNSSDSQKGPHRQRQ